MDDLGSLRAVRLKLVVVALLCAVALWLLVKGLRRRYREAQRALLECSQALHLTMLARAGFAAEAEREMRGWEQDALLERVYFNLAARFHEEGYRVDGGGSTHWVLSKEARESLCVFGFSMVKGGTTPEIYCGAGVCFRAVDELLEPVFISHEVARRHPASCTFTYIPFSDRAFRECWVATTGTVEQIGDRVWAVFGSLQSWLQDNSDLRKAALALEALITTVSPSDPDSRTYAKLVAAYHHLGDSSEKVRCLEAMIADSLWCDPAEIGESAPFYARDLLEHLRWAKLHLGLEVPPVEPVNAWCIRCIQMNPQRAAQLWPEGYQQLML